MRRPLTNYTPGKLGEGLRVGVRSDQHRGYKLPLDSEEVEDMEPSALSYWSNVTEKRRSE